MKVSRKDRSLNDAIEYLDDVYARAQSNVQVAIGMLAEDELAFIYDETEKCLERRYYLENYHCIRDEHGQWKAMYPWWDHQEIVYEVIQEEFAENGQCRIIVLKPRQTGVSTWISAAMFHQTIFTPHSYTMLVAQDGDTSSHVYNMSINAYHALPWWLKPEFLYKTKGDQIEFQRADEAMRSINPGLGSILKCSNAAKMSGVAIGRSITNLHASEVSRWPSAEVYEADIKPSMNARNMFEVMESTGLGRNGLFYEQWQGAVAGDNDLRPVFIPVYKVRKYYLPIKGQFVATVEERLFAEKVAKEEKFEIPDEFWNFRRKGIRAAKTSQGGKAGFLESYPISPSEAFQASGICAFDRDTLEEQQMKYVCKPIFAGEISLAFDNKTPNTAAISQVADDEQLPKRKGDRPSKRLHIWELPEKGETYYVSGDTALGVADGDYSNATVFRAGVGSAPDTMVANWWGHIPPQDFAKICAALGYWYNDAELAIEYQGPGMSTGDKLVELDYPTLYRERMKDRPGGTYKQYFHFVTNTKTRDSIISTMNEALLAHNRNNEPGVILRCEELLDEMVDFGSIGGRMEGQGNHDDGVFGAMIGLYCLRETTPHLKGSANDEARESEHVGDINQYAVFDHLQRQRGQYQSRQMAESVIFDKPGWVVQPVLICKANTLWSPIYDGNDAENKLRFQHGLSARDITPDMVYSFRSVMQQHATVGSSDPDW